MLDFFTRSISLFGTHNTYVTERLRDIGQVNTVYSESEKIAFDDWQGRTQRKRRNIYIILFRYQLSSLCCTLNTMEAGQMAIRSVNADNITPGPWQCEAPGAATCQTWSEPGQMSSGRVCLPHINFVTLFVRNKKRWYFRTAHFCENENREWYVCCGKKWCLNSLFKLDNVCTPGDTV